jgi:hypothetical protein
MTQAIEIQLADAVKDALNGRAWSLALAAARPWLPDYKLETINTTVVAVAPRAASGQRISRGVVSEELAVDVLVLERPETADGKPDCTAARFDALALLVQEIRDFFVGWKSPAVGMGATCLRWERPGDGPFDAVLARSERTFASVVRLVFQVARLLPATA